LKRLLLFLISAPLFGASTTVTQSVVGPDGQPAAGQALIRISAACKSGTIYVGDRTIAVKFTAATPQGQANNFSVALVPNDACVPAGTSYSVSWTLTGGRAWTETWLVPTSGTAVSIDSVVITTTPTPTWLIQWPQIAQGGAATGQAPVWNGSSWSPGYVTGSGAAWGALTGTLCNQSDLCTALAGKVGTSDARLSDARTPLAHVHLIADVTGLQTALNGKQGTLGFTAENVANRGTASGYAPLDSSAHLPAANTAALNGDVAKAAGASGVTVTGIQGSPVASAAPADGQMMRWSASAGQWQPVAVRYTKTFTGVTTLVIPGTEHNLGTADLTVTCFDASGRRYGFDTLTIAPTTFDVTITHAVAQDGRCVLR